MAYPRGMMDWPTLVVSGIALGVSICAFWYTRRQAIAQERPLRADFCLDLRPPLAYGADGQHSGYEWVVENCGKGEATKVIVTGFPEPKEEFSVPPGGCVVLCGLSDKPGLRTLPGIGVAWRDRGSRFRRVRRIRPARLKDPWLELQVSNAQ